MEKMMIRVTTGEHYRVPEDMFPQAAEALVNCGRAQWVERVPEKKSLIKRAAVQTAALAGNVRTAARQFFPFSPRVTHF